MGVAVLMSNQKSSTLLRLFLGTAHSLSLLTDVCLEGTLVLDLVLDCRLFPLSQLFTSDHSVLKHLTAHANPGSMAAVLTQSPSGMIR